MELDEMKELWAQSNEKLAASMRLNTVLLQQWNLRAADTSLKRLAREVTFELIVNVATIVLLGYFIGAHLHELQYLIPAIALDVYAIAVVVAGSRQLAETRGLDFDEPVVAIQKKLEVLRVRRIRTTLAVLLFAPLMWLPILIVAARGFFGVDVYSAGTPWLVGNVLFGLAFVGVSVFVTRRYGERLAKTTPMRLLADAIAGRNLTAALESLDAIQRFEAEP